MKNSIPDVVKFKIVRWKKEKVLFLVKGRRVYRVLKLLAGEIRRGAKKDDQFYQVMKIQPLSVF